MSRFARRGAASMLLAAVLGGCSAPSVLTSDNSVVIRADNGDTTLELTVTRQRCTDSMSGSVFAYGATLKRSGRTLPGYAVRGPL